MKWWWKKSPAQPPKVPENWGVYLRHPDQVPYLVLLNLALADVKVRPVALILVMRVRVKLREPAEDQVMCPAERPVLQQIEDALVNTTGKRIGALFVGHIIGGGYYECIFYVPGSASTALGKTVVSKMGDYELTTALAEDTSWRVYHEELFPDSFGKQQMLNQHVLLALQKQGDTLEQPRHVDHWIYFKEAQSRSAFVERVRGLAFETSESELEPAQPLRYCARIGREDSVRPLEIDRLTTALVALAEEFGGEYDGWETKVIKQ